ncbi:MAG: recombinase family protein [Proteobacteria bacterium]|nr:recombinase family protein [Pseudomonadota bacterium]
MAVIYIRVSTKEQQEEGYSLDAQLKFLMDYASKNNIIIVQTFLDVESAKVAGRKQFGNLVKFLKSQALLPSGSNCCQTVLVEKTDRFYRNIEDQVTIKDLGITAIFAKENMIMSPASKSHDKFTHTLNVALASRFSDNLSEETKKGMLEKAMQGLCPSQAPIGFANVEGPSRKRIIVQDPVLAPLVKRMFTLYATGNYSTRELCIEATKLGLVHRRSGRKLSKAVMWDILNNPIYYGDFYWVGVLYNGTHEPIISKELYDNVQKALNKRSSCPTGRQKHNFLFQGMLTCGHCGCAVVAEMHKGKYIYYRCTHNQGKCPDKYAREVQIEEQFIQSLDQIKIDDDVLAWVVSAMGTASAESKKQREAQAIVANKQRQSLEDNLDKMYLDKLEGIICDEEYVRLSKKFRTDLTDVKFRIEGLAEGKEVCIDNGKRLLELSQKAASLYSAQIPAEKRKLLNMVYSNSTWAGGELAPNYRKPFDIIADSNQAYQRKKATFPEENDLFDIWRP